MEHRKYQDDAVLGMQRSIANGAQRIMLVAHAYAAAMELAEARAWRKEVWEETQKPWPFVKELRRSVKMAPLWSIFDSFDYAEVCVKKAEKRVDEVFL